MSSLDGTKDLNICYWPEALPFLHLVFTGLLSTSLDYTELECVRPSARGTALSHPGPSNQELFSSFPHPPAAWISRSTAVSIG